MPSGLQLNSLESSHMRRLSLNTQLTKIIKTAAETRMPFTGHQRHSQAPWLAKGRREKKGQ
jgi:hypothetical protein